MSHDFLLTYSSLLCFGLFYFFFSFKYLMFSSASSVILSHEHGKRIMSSDFFPLTHLFGTSKSQSVENTLF